MAMTKVPTGVGAAAPGGGALDYLLVLSIKGRHVSVFHHDTSVHDHLDAGLPGFRGRFVVNDTQLHPDGFDPDSDALFHHRRNTGEIDEEVGHIKGKWDVFKGLVAGSFQYLLLARVYGDYVITLFQEVSGDLVAVPGCFGGKPHDGNPL